jgi:hypothetical protein
MSATFIDTFPDELSTEDMPNYTWEASHCRKNSEDMTASTVAMIAQPLPQRRLALDTMVLSTAPDSSSWPISPASPFGPPDRWLKLLPDPEEPSSARTPRPKQSLHAEKVTRTETTSTQMPQLPNTWLMLLPDLEPSYTAPLPELAYETPESMIRISGLREFDEATATPVPGDTVFCVDEEELESSASSSVPDTSCPPTPNDEESSFNEYVFEPLATQKPAPPTTLYQFSAEDNTGGFHWTDPFMSEDEFNYNYSDHDVLAGSGGPWLSAMRT